MTVTEADPEAETRAREKMWEDQNRLAARQAQRRSRDQMGGGSELTADFLDDDDELEGNLGAIRKRFKSGKGGGGGAGKGGRRVGRTAGARRGRQEEEESGDEEAEPGEMDDFLVDGSDEEDGSGEEEEDWDDED